MVVEGKNARAQRRCDRQCSKKHVPSWFREEETPGVSVPPGEETLSPSTTGTTTKSSLASQSTKKPAMNSHACDTEDCLYMSEMLIAMLNFNVDPCEDFYQYVCGSGGAPEGNAFTAISKKIRPSIVSTIYMTYPAADTQPAWQKATTLFMACAALKKTEKSEVTAVKNWLAGLDLDMATIHIGYPFDSIDMLVRCSFQLGIPAVFAFTVHKLTFTNGKRNVLVRVSLVQRQLIQPKQMYVIAPDPFSC
ncbi:hypothetical protein HPB48_009892 [Haemaphysalis longicornis]|uniref:Peptidase M13 N-terminal domain-containing protein n=1 Tax=Haemaphysalis longicornis TaxID=44386 RepID=A0A9J6GU54_HAELO|nr:hypothetical protein HPB48_009892 [Haemaphysalis longicornis]